MAYETMSLQMTDGLARLVLNQPAIGNPFNEAFCREWAEVANELTNYGEDLRAVLLTANGKFFSVGGDIGMFTRTLDTLPAKIREWTVGLHMGTARFARLNAPVVAAVHGTAMGGAVALIAGCDLVYCSSNATFGAAYASIGYSVDAGASTNLTARMGMARARRFVLCSEILKANEAATAGLVDFVVEEDVLLAEAEKAALRFAKGPTRAYGEIRRLFRNAMYQPFETQLEDEAQTLARMGGTADAREGILSFAEKRKAVFVGK